MAVVIAYLASFPVSAQTRYLGSDGFYSIRGLQPINIASNQCGLLLTRTDSTFSIDGQTINAQAITDVQVSTSSGDIATIG